MRGRAMLVTVGAALALCAGAAGPGALGVTAASAAGRIAVWNAGDGIQCSADSAGAGEVTCAGYPRARTELVFTLRGGTGRVAKARSAGNSDPGAHPRPPVRYTHVGAHLVCKRGVGSVLVVCANSAHGFALGRRSYEVK